MASLLKTIATTPEVLALLLFLTVPGFVFVRAFDELHPARRRGSGQLIIDSGLWSCLILAVWFMPALILFELGPRLPYWLYHLLLFVFILLGVFSTAPPPGVHLPQTGTPWHLEKLGHQAVPYTFGVALLQ